MHDATQIELQSCNTERLSKKLFFTAEFDVKKALAKRDGRKTIGLDNKTYLTYCVTSRITHSKETKGHNFIKKINLQIKSIIRNFFQNHKIHIIKGY
jgi:hypothetical protein